MDYNPREAEDKTKAEINEFYDNDLSLLYQQHTKDIKHLQFDCHFSK